MQPDAYVPPGLYDCCGHCGHCEHGINDPPHDLPCPEGCTGVDPAAAAGEPLW